MKTTNERYEYRTTPLGIVMPKVWYQSAEVTLEKIKSIPRVEKVAMSHDLAKEYKGILDAPIEKLKNRCETDLLWFLNWGMGFLDIDPVGRIPYQVDIAEMYESDCLRIMVIVPREHFKSTYTQGYIGQELLKNPNKTFLVRCNNSRNASYFIDVIQKRIKSSNILMLYGNLEGDRWSSEAMTVRTRTEFTRDPNVLATGVGTDVTSLHPDEGIFDDVQSEGNNTEEGRATVIADYQDMASVIKRRKIINGTRWDDLDFYNYILEKNATLKPDHRDKYKVLIMSAYGKADADGNTPEVGTPIFSYTYRNDKPETIEGVVKDENWIQTRRFELGATKFSNQILNNPIPSENQVFHEEDFNKWEILPEGIEKSLSFYLAIDPAGTRERYSDYTAFVVAGVTPDYNIYIPYAKQVQVDVTKSKKIIDRIFLLNKIYKFKKVGIEQGLLERVFREPIKTRMWISEEHPFTLRALKYAGQPGSSSPKKDDRIVGMQPYIEGGRFHINSKCFDLINQLIRWRPGKTSHDDLVDAMAYLLQLIPRHIQKEIFKAAKTVYQQYMERRFRGDKNKDYQAEFLNQGVM